MTTTILENQLNIERTFDAPPAVIWKLWTEAEHLSRWWGPQHFTTPAFKVDLRVGGKYVYCMLHPDGSQMWATGVFKEITPYTRLVFTDSFADAEGNVVPASTYEGMSAFLDESEIVLTFEALPGGKTRLTLQHHGIPAEMSETGVASGWNESFDKLNALALALV